MNEKYYLSTGEIDYERLSILSRLYNPLALNFLTESGLKPGMTVLEVGCGSGHMACDLAKLVGPTGKVIAIDSSEEQIKMARKTASHSNIDNIEFYVCDVFDLATINKNYDATYGRWVIEFTQQPEKALEIMYQHLNRGGILCYESTSVKQYAYFTYPHVSVIDEWFTIGPRMYESYGYNANFSHEAPQVFKRLNCHNIKAKSNQAILLTPEEKSVYRLAIITAKAGMLHKGIMTEQQIEKLYNDVLDFEQSDAISGFYSNILVSGIK